MTIRILLLLILSCLPAPLQAAGMKQDDFAALPVQHEGRIKPIDTFARAMLEHFSGRESLDGMSADAWLAETLFDPALALHRPVFRIFRPEQLDLPPRKSRYYSFAELAPALNARAAVIQELSAQPEQEWSNDQRELMRLSEASFLYTQLLRSFTLLLPLNVALPDSLAKDWKVTDGQPFTLQEYRPYQERLKKRVQAIVQKKGDDPETYTEEERQIVQFAMDVNVLEQSGEANILLRIVPGIEGETWHSPWSFAEEGQGSPLSGTYLKLWQDMAAAYQREDIMTWNDTTRQAAEMAKTFNATQKLKLESLYNQLHPLLLSGVLYLAAFFSLIAYNLAANKIYHRLGFIAVGLGCLTHALAIIARVVILDRAPVGTLYESILFVALVCVIVSLVLEWPRKDGQGLLLGSVSGLLLLFTAESFADGDTMKMLVAVLNTNFWLSTHVLCITMGYGFCVIASLMAHAWLVKTAVGREPRDLVKPIKIMSLIALLFTTVGTILGGIWADQSWGRFWGWDPKENGALLIVLWLAWILHGQISGHLNRTGFMAGIAALSIVVALAWFGVNLLSVGLHSYGFITGVAAGLGSFCILEILLIGVLWQRTRKEATA